VNCSSAKSDWAEEIAATLDLVGLGDRADGRTRNLLKGHAAAPGPRRRAAWPAGAGCARRTTSALDPVGRQDVRRIIGRCEIEAQRSSSTRISSLKLSAFAIAWQSWIAAAWWQSCRWPSWSEIRRARARDGSNEGAIGAASRHGPSRIEGEWLSVEGIVDADIPDLVRDLVASAPPSTPSFQPRVARGPVMALLGVRTSAETATRPIRRRGG